jgi:hypothetical protein
MAKQHGPTQRAQAAHDIHLRARPEEKKMRFVERPLKSVTYKNGQVFVDAEELTAILRSATTRHPQSKAYTTTARVIDDFFSGIYFTRGMQVRRVSSAEHGQLLIDDGQVQEKQSDPVQVSAAVILNQGLVSKHCNRSVLLKTLGYHATDWDEDHAEALQESREAIEAAVQEGQEAPRPTIEIRLHYISSLGPLDPLIYPHQVVEDPGNQLSWVGNGGGVYYIVICTKFEFDGTEVYRVIIKFGSTKRSLPVRIPEVLAQYAKYKGRCQVQFVHQTDKPRECETAFKRMATELGLIHPCYDQDNSEERKELLWYIADSACSRCFNTRTFGDRREVGRRAEVGKEARPLRTICFCFY